MVLLLGLYPGQLFLHIELPAKHQGIPATCKNGLTQLKTISHKSREILVANGPLRRDWNNSQHHNNLLFIKVLASAESLHFSTARLVMSSAAQKLLYLATASKWAQFEADVVYWKSQAAAYCILIIGMVWHHMWWHHHMCKSQT
jgi:hypothetical protein